MERGHQLLAGLRSYPGVSCSQPAQTWEQQKLIFFAQNIFNTRNYILSYDCRIGLGLSGHLKERHETGKSFDPGVYWEL